MIEAVREYTGGCFCGSIRYRATGQLGGVSHCHCSMCRRVCGAPFVTWVSFKRANFSFTCGTPTRFKSSDKVERSFCNLCGTAIAFEETTRSQWVDVTVGSLDQPNAVFPEDHIWTSSKLSWLHINDCLLSNRKKNAINRDGFK